MRCSLPICASWWIRPAFRTTVCSPRSAPRRCDRARLPISTVLSRAESCGASGWPPPAHRPQHSPISRQPALWRPWWPGPPGRDHRWPTAGNAPPVQPGIMGIGRDQPGQHRQMAGRRQRPRQQGIAQRAGGFGHLAAHRPGPGIEQRLLRQILTGQKRLGGLIKQRLQPFGRQQRRASGDGGAHIGHIQQQAVAGQANIVAAGQQAIGMIQQRPQLGQAPAQGGAGIIGNVPQQFAQRLAAMAARFQRQPGQQRTRLARRRQRAGHAIGMQLHRPKARQGQHHFPNRQTAGICRCKAIPQPISTPISTLVPTLAPTPRPQSPPQPASPAGQPPHRRLE